ncbi:MAG: GspE/PulE family protein [Holosporaceae bacterium]|jgi:general secretion pathway protein E/type IV pilus assembly protein PilB|nr:GspE/PulE family protein [Holosporaceae bacterium]
MVSNYSLNNIGNTLLSRGLLTQEQIKVIVKCQEHSNLLFGQLAVNLGFLKENALIKILSDMYLIDAIDLEFTYVNREILSLLDYETASSCRAIPFSLKGDHVHIAISDPGNLRAVDAVRARLRNRQVKFFLAKESEISRFLEIMKCSLESLEQDPLFLLNKIIFNAVEKKASDVHFEPHENFLRVRLRIDGILQVLQTVDLESWMRIRSKLKLMANLNITENRRPQSGHTRISIAGKTIDLRISTHPGIHGENFVTRIFDLADGVRPLSQLGFSKEDYTWLKTAISRASGIFIIVGPTGSGKTTTLYSLLKEINSCAVNIMTLEDPVEYQINGVKQLDLRDEGILSFSDGVRSILRQDPDVMLIGEIRDEVTAATAIRASLTGRLVLATLHASTPLEGLRRLVDLGLKPADFIPSLVGIFSQRLVRRLDHGEYQGRFPIVEYIYFSKQMRKDILRREDITTCKVDKSFSISATAAVENGLTDLEEIKRVMGDAYL